MENVHLLTVATHNEGYYNALKKSAIMNDYDLKTLGWGQKWQGFIMKMNLFIESLNSFNDNDIIIMIDAYDVIILDNKEILIKKFKKLNKPIVLSKDGDVNNNLFKYVQDKIFHGSHNHRLCAGLMMGYTWALKELFNLICGEALEKCNKPFLDDQILLIDTYYDMNNRQFFKQNTIVDSNNEIFYNTYGNTKYFEFNFEIADLFYEKNNKLYLNNTDISPCIIHGPGNTNLNSICHFYNLPIAKKISRDTSYRIKMYTKPMYLKKFSDEILKIKICIIVLLITYAYLYLKE